jgi:EAL and modified HD-GYP domain-containing signal transduction protein
MSDQVYLARQPIFDAGREIYGYELFYRNEAGERGSGTPRFATSSVLVNLLNQIGTQRCVGDKRAFVNIDSSILLSEILSTLPPELFVFELSEQMTVTHREIEAVAQLHRRGYTFALDNVSLSEEYLSSVSELFPHVTYAKFDTTMTDFELLTEQIGRFAGLTLIAQKVEFPEMVESYAALGFEYFQGNFFAPPALLQQGALSPKHLGVIRFYNMLQNETPLEQLAEEFQRHNELSMQLLQFIGSTALGNPEGSASIREIIERLGPQKLRLWFLLLIFSKSGRYISSDKSLFSLRIQRRIDLMLSLVPRLGMEERPEVIEQIRFLAFLSLIEEVFNVPLAAILKNIEVHDSIGEALLSKHGEYGRLLALAEAIELSHIDAIRAYLKPFGITIDDIADLIAEYQGA